MADMTQAEGEVMEAHFGYWAQVIAERKAVAYGPVLDPAGGYGMALLDVADEAAASAVVSDDPAIRSDAGFRHELHPMVDVIVRDG